MNRKILSIVILAATSSLICLSSCSNESSKLPKVDSYLLKEVPAYNGYWTTPIGVMYVAQFNDSTVGYFDIDYLVKEFIEDKPYKAEYGDKTYKITNTQTQAYLIVDFNKQTITYSNYDAYNCHETPYTPYIDQLIEQNKSYFINTLSTCKYLTKDDTTKVIDFSKYNIPLYFYEGNGYIPIDIFPTFITTFHLTKISYNGMGVYLNGIDNSYETLISYQNEANIFNKEYMEYTYNLTALELDNIFGLDEKAYSSASGKVKKFLDKDIYDIMEPYHNDLVSLEPNVADNALSKLLCEQFDDGGHTGLGTNNCLIDENYESHDFGEELTYRNNISKKLTTVRKAANCSPAQITGNEESLNAFNVIDDTAFVTFDKFVGMTNDPLPITSSNYWKNTYFTISYANEQIRNNSNIKNLVIDLSLNTGGESGVEHFVGSWLCNGVTTKVRNTKIKTYEEATYYADVNFDGQYTELDYIPSNINLYCIVSIASFSCGNLLPTQLAGQTNTKFIGNTSGGGSCMVYDGIPTGLGNFYQISNMYQLGLYSSTSYDNFTSNENGINADLYQISYSDTDLPKFYDRTTIIDKIHESQK